MAGYMVVIVMVGLSENGFLHAIPNIENTFPANFSKHKKTTENILNSENTCYCRDKGPKP